MIQFKNKKKKMLTELPALFNYGLFLLGLREYSVSQVRKKMQTRCEMPELIEEALQKLETANYLSDERKAQSILSQYGKKEAGSKLMQRFALAGIDKELTKKTIEDSIAQAPQDDNLNNCLEILTRKFKVYDELKKDKYVRFLCSRGFSYGMCSKVIKIFKDGPEEN